MGAARQVTVAGQIRTIEKFSGRKVAVALKMIGRLATTYGDIADDVATFRQEYAVKRPVRITRDQVMLNMSDLSTAIGQARTDRDVDDEQREIVVGVLEDTREAYRNLLEGALSEKESVERPGAASPEEIFMHVAPRALEVAEDDVVRLLGVALMTNHEIGESRRAGTLEDRALSLGDEAMDNGDIDEILEAILAAAEMLLGDIAHRRDRLGKITALFRPASAEESPQEATPDPEHSTLTDGRPTGSTDSAPPTPDGPPTTPSTESATPSAAGSSI